jgi:uncharacterized protein (TIGR02186 family)
MRGNAALLLLLAGLAAAPHAAQGQDRDPLLVPEVSQHQIRVRQGFTGTEVLLFGAILDPSGRSAAREHDIVVVLKGPTDAVQLREKQKIAGIWINADSSDFRSVPSFFALASSRPIGELVDERTAAIYELGLDYLQLSPTGSIDPVEQARFIGGLVDLRRRQGLYQEDQGGVSISEGVLYQARIAIPSNVQTGRYTAETFAIAEGRVITSAISEIEVVKEGFERLVAVEAEDNSVLYGLFAVALSLFMGWLAGRAFALV